MMGNPADSSHWLGFLTEARLVFLDASVKGVLLLAAAAIVANGMRRCSAAMRHLMWLLALLGLFALPVLSWTLPGWNILPRWMELQQSRPARQWLQAAPEQPVAAAQPQRQTFKPAERPAPAPIEAVETPPISSKPPSAPIAQVKGNGTLTTHFDWLWMAAWLAGFALVILRTVTGLAGLWRLERRSRVENSLSWVDLLRRLAAGVGLRRPVVLLKSHQRQVPMTWGVIRPRLLLPDSSEDWPEERRRVVLLHELAHVRRWDYATNLVTRLACAAWWFNPMVWLAARHLAAERERACDDIVLNHGARPAQYAEQILEIAAGLRAGKWTEAAGIAMTRPSKLEGRLRAILDANRNRANLTRAAVFSSLVVLTAILIPVAMIKAAPGPPPANPQSAIPNPQSAIGNSQSEWGEPTNGLRTRLVAEKHEFRAGEPIRIRIEVTNTSDRAIKFQIPSAPYFREGLILVDSEGTTPPFVGESLQVMTGDTNVAPGRTIQLEPFELTERRYLRRAGSYTVQLPAEPFPMRMPGFSLPGLPRSGKLTFEVIADAAADADGDPIGRLLALLPEKWSLENHGNKIGPLRPGGNRVEATGRAFTLYAPTGSRMVADSGAIWLWLTEKPAAEQQDHPADTIPASEYLGQAGRFSVYISPDATALKDWPTAENDILRALQSTVVNFDTEPRWGEPVRGFQVRLRAPADAGAGEAWPRLLVDITNQGPMRFVSTTNSFTWQLEVDGHWYVSKDDDPKVTRGRNGLPMIEGGIAMSLDLVPGQAWTSLPLVLDSAWRVAGPEDLTFQRFGSWAISYPDNPLMNLPPGKHTVRLAVVADSRGAAVGGPVRAISNPVEVKVAARGTAEE